MRKTLLILTGILSLWLLPTNAFSFCLSFDSFSATIPTNPTDNCTVNLAWTFEECGLTGTYYVQYSTDGTTYYIIASQNGAANSGSGSYSYQDDYAHPAASDAAAVYYRIMFVSFNTGNPYYSSVSVVRLGSSSCSANATTRCNSLPANLSITGPATLCNPSQGSYALSSTIPTVWTLSAGSGLTSQGTPGGGIALTNSGSDGIVATLSTNVFGCRTLSQQIEVGVLPNFGYSLTASVPNFCINSFGNTVSLEPGSYTYPDLSFEWGYVDIFSSGPPTVVNSFGTVIQDFTFSTASLYEIYARAKNSCGYFMGNTGTLDIEAQDCSGGGPGGLAHQQGRVAGRGSILADANNTLSVFPNPATDKIAVLLPDSLDLDHLSVRLLDLTGKMVQPIAPVSHLLIVKVSGLAKGMYILAIDDGKKIVTKKIVRL
jgi:hypothetical protein